MQYSITFNVIFIEAFPHIVRLLALNQKYREKFVWNKNKNKLRPNPPFTKYLVCEFCSQLCEQSAKLCELYPHLWDLCVKLCELCTQLCELCALLLELCAQFCESV